MLLHFYFLKKSYMFLVVVKSHLVLVSNFKLVFLFLKKEKLKVKFLIL